MYEGADVAFAQLSDAHVLYLYAMTMIILPCHARAKIVLLYATCTDIIAKASLHVNAQRAEI